MFGEKVAGCDVLTCIHHGVTLETAKRLRVESERYLRRPRSGAQATMQPVPPVPHGGTAAG